MSDNIDKADSPSDPEKTDVSVDSDASIVSETCESTTTLPHKTSTEDAVTIEKSCENMIQKIADYLNGELTAASEEYKLIEKLNNLTVAKYDEMSATTKELITKNIEINEKYRSLQPYLTQIDLLEESVLKLEQTAYKLDAYSKQLEMKFKNLERR